MLKEKIVKLKMDLINWFKKLYGLKDEKKRRFRIYVQFVFKF